MPMCSAELAERLLFASLASVAAAAQNTELAFRFTALRSDNDDDMATRDPLAFTLSARSASCGWMQQVGDVWQNSNAKQTRMVSYGFPAPIDAIALSSEVELDDISNALAGLSLRRANARSAPPASSRPSIAVAPTCQLVASARLSGAPAHGLDGGSMILNPWQLVCWGCMLMACSLMAWHHRFAKSPYTRPQPRGKHGQHRALSTLHALCTMLPFTEATDNDVPALYSVQHVLTSHRRALQTAVSTSAGLTSALANTATSHIVLAPGTYYLSAELSVTRSVVIEAAVAGSVVLHAQASSSSMYRVLYIDPGWSGVVQLIGLNITGGNTVSVLQMVLMPAPPNR
jgi:hypothetical protein